VADFGTVRRGVEEDEDKTHVSTRVIAGTRVYMPPEYSQTGHVSERTDSCKWAP
jgi:hypothetical protein